MDLEVFDFSEHMHSIEWIGELPKSYLSNPVDRRFYEVTLVKNNRGYEIYIGPKNPDLGGEGLMIWLDKDCRLKEYVVEIIEPVPKF